MVVAALADAAADQAAQSASDQDGIGRVEEGSHVLAVGTSPEAERHTACQEIRGQAGILGDRNADLAVARSSKEMGAVAEIVGVGAGVAAAAAAAAAAAVMAAAVAEVLPGSAPEASKEWAVGRSVCRNDVSETSN